MSEEHHSDSIHLSLSELAWASFLILVLIFAISQNDVRVKDKEQKILISQYADLLKNSSLLLEQIKAKGKTLEEEYADLNHSIEELNKERESLIAQCNDLKKQLLDAQEQNKADVKSLREEILALKEKNAALEIDNKTQKEKVAALEADRMALEEKVTALEVNNSDLKKQIDIYKKYYVVIGRDMIDIKGGLDKVVCVVDCSASMTFLSTKRWSETQRRIKAWISYLDIKELALITYNKTATVHTKDFLDIGKREPNEINENIKQILKYLESVIPQSSSNTYEALERAYEFKPDTIILFTNGSPSRNTKSGIDESEMNRIIEDLIKKHQDIPVNIVGIGDYFNDKTGTYFRKITELTRGSFIGR